MASLRLLTETALSGALATITDANIYTGIDEGDKELPCIICRAVSAEEISHNMGNYHVTCEVTIKALAGDDDAFDALCESARDLVLTDDFITALNITGLKVWGLASEDKIDWGTDGDAWTETRTLVLACAACELP